MNHRGTRSTELYFPKRNRKSAKGRERTKESLRLSNSLSIKFTGPAFRVFLYLKPTEIICRRERHGSFDITLEHQFTPISKLTDCHNADNVIHLNTFSEEKPTFSLPINQDDIDEIMRFSDSPLKVTLYESMLLESDSSESAELDMKLLRRVAVAQGYLDLIPYFFLGRAQTSLKIFLYPLGSSSDGGNCQIMWDIYSLMPLVKEVKLSNIIFISFGSLFNVANSLLEDCDDLVATLSWRPKDPKMVRYKKQFICNYTAFRKRIINQQSGFYKWENLKDHILKNYDSLGIYSGVNFSIYDIFTDLLCTENAAFNFADINRRADYALVCNSIHRFVLTDTTHVAFERILSCDQYEVSVEIFKQSEPKIILLQGSIDLSVFMYPNGEYGELLMKDLTNSRILRKLYISTVTSCSFAIELKRPTLRHTHPHTSSSRNSTSRKIRKSSRTSSTERSIDEISKKKPFAIINVCLKLPITEPAENLNVVFNLGEVERNIFNDCWTSDPKCVRRKESIQLLQNRECKQHYKSFDDNILQILNYLVKNNIQSISERPSYYCGQVKNLVNRISPLIACDFNIRCPTETNIEFVNLTTIVFRELVGRCYDLIEKKSLLDPNIEVLILREINFAKFLYHIGNENMSRHLFDVLEKKYGYNPMYRFSMFLHDIEMENFESAREYLNMPLSHKHMDALFVIDLCELYMDYMDDIKSAKDKCYITENLLKALRHYCEEVNPKFPVGWMVLYCVYKKHDYRPGMNYTRWKYENLTEELFTDIIRIPKSRWEIFNNFQPSLKTGRGKYFWQACEFLLKLGLYYFARWLFDDIINELQKVEIYIVDASLQLAEKLIPPIFALERPSLEESEKSISSKANELNAFVYLVNGNIEYYRDPDDLNAMKHYGSLLHIKSVGKDPRFELGILRYAYRMLEEKQLEEALKAFQFARSLDHRIIGYVGKAKALYFLDRLEEAEIYFAKSTRFYMHLPNVWAYLAVINLRLGQNYKALECWKYARLDPDVIFDDEILNELEKLDIETLFLVNA